MKATTNDTPHRSVAAATFAAGGVIAHQVIGKTTRDSFFLSNYDVELLPIVMIVAALLAGAAVLGFSRLLALYSPARAVPSALAANVLFLLVEWALSLVSPELAALAVYAHMSIFGGILVSGFWSMYNERFDPYAAKQAMGRVGTGGSVGGVAGGLAALSLANFVPPSSLLLVMALLASATLAGVVMMSRGGHPKSRKPSRVVDTDPDAEEPSSGLQVVREVPYLRTLALIVGLSAATEALLDYVLAAQAKANAASDAELVTFFSLFYTGVGLAGLLVQAFAARRSLELFGLAGSVAFKPASYVLGGLLGALLPRLSTAVIIRAVPAILHNSVFRSGYELLYTPLPDRQKRPAKALVDVGVDKLGMVGGGAVTLLVVAVAADVAVQVLPAVAVVFGALVLALCRRVEGGYIAALEASLRSGAVTLSAEQIIDSSTRLSMLHSQLESGHGRTLAAGGDSGSSDPVVQTIRDLHSKNALRIRTVLRAPELEPRVVAHVIPLLAQDDLARDAVRALRTVVARTTGQLIDALVDDRQPASVRRRMPRVLKNCTTQRAADGLSLGLADEAFAVRYECGVALARIAERDSKLRIDRDTVLSVVETELERHRSEDKLIQHVFNLLSLVLDNEPLKMAYWALKSDGAQRGTALEYLDTVLPDNVRRAMWPVLGADKAATRTPRPQREVVDELLKSRISHDPDSAAGGSD